MPKQSSLLKRKKFAAAGRCRPHPGRLRSTDVCVPATQRGRYAVYPGAVLATEVFKASARPAMSFSVWAAERVTLRRAAFLATVG